MTTKLMFSEEGNGLWGYLSYVFLFLLLADMVIYRKFNKEAKIALYGICVVYLGLCILGYLFPLIDLWDTTKRGLFKMFPLMLLYMRNSGMLQQLSQWLTNWEAGLLQPAVAAAKPAPVAAQKRPAPKPVVVQKQSVPAKSNKNPQQKPGKARK
jgi:hypothetical protein